MSLIRFAYISVGGGTQGHTWFGIWLHFVESDVGIEMYTRDLALSLILSSRVSRTSRPGGLAIRQSTTDERGARTVGYLREHVPRAYACK